MEAQEAIKRLKHHFAIHDDGRPTPRLDEAAYMAIKALEITDRLKRAETRICGNPIVVSIFVRTAGESDAWIDGYKQALVDIRGDNNDD